MVKGKEVRRRQGDSPTVDAADRKEAEKRAEANRLAEKENSRLCVRCGADKLYKIVNGLYGGIRFAPQPCACETAL